MNVVVTGASGLIGSALVPALRDDGHTVMTLVRRPPRAQSEVQWDPAAGRLDDAALAGVEAAVNLAGANVGAHRWTDAYKRTVRDSRLLSTTLLAETLARLEPRPRVLLSASGIHYYGDTGDKIIDESAPAGQGFLADLSRDWEAATTAAETAGIRVCHLRTGFVLSGRGGALARQLPLFRWGVGGRLGSGHQWWSWISLDDQVGAIRFLLGAEGVHGPVNLVSPQPVTNTAFTAALAAALRRPALFPVPPFALKIVVGDLAEAPLSSQRLLPEVLTGAGFRFRHPNLSSALTAAVNKEF